MTLPTNVTLPLEESLILSDKPADLLEYLRKLIYVLSNNLQAVNQSLNGRTYLFDTILNPTYNFIQGSTAVGTATYTSSVLLIRRTSSLNFVNFDITWAGHTGTGNVQIPLNFAAQSNIGRPFAGVIESDGNAFSAGYTYLTCNIAPGSNLIDVNQNGTGVPILALPLAAAGHIRGNIIYAGNQFN